MTWQQRLGAILLAGGVLVAGCGDDEALHGGADLAIGGGGDMTYQFVCNGNPDPCCLHPELPQCPKDGGAGD